MTHYTKGTPSPRSQGPGARRQEEGFLVPGPWFLTPEAPTACRHPVSGTLSLPSSGCFSPFPHGTGALSVTDEYLALEGGPPRFRRDSSCPAVLRYPDHPLVNGFAYGALTLFGGPLQAASATIPMRTGKPHPDPTTPDPKARFGLFPVRSPLLGESRLISFPGDT